MIRKPVISQFFGAALIASLTLTNTSVALAATLAEHLLEKNEKHSIIEEHSQAQPTSEHLSVAKTAAIENQTTTGQSVGTKKASTLARAMSEYTVEKEEVSVNFERTLILDISELQDSAGLVYLGGKVSEVELSRYLSQLKGELGKEQYITYREHQAARDHQSFHVTFVNPYEYQTINKEKLKISQKIRVTLHGLGKVEKDNKTSYFVVASSSDGQFMRQKLLLKNKDFHVTLGFYPDDVYGVRKGRDTLINK
jgi:hypothetical protein